MTGLAPSAASRRADRHGNLDGNVPDLIRVTGELETAARREARIHFNHYGYNSPKLASNLSLERGNPGWMPVFTGMTFLFETPQRLT